MEHSSGKPNKKRIFSSITHLTNGIITSKISWVCSRKVGGLQSAELFIAIAVDSRAVGARYEVAQVILRLGRRIFRPFELQFLLTFATREAVRQRQIQRALIPAARPRRKLLLIILEYFRPLIVGRIHFIVKIIRRLMCFFSHILISVRLYSSVAHHGLLLRQKLIIYSEVKVVSALLPKEFEELNSQDEGACLAVEHSWAP